MSQPNYIVASFNESPNEVPQKGLMDLYIRYWDISTSKVLTENYNSALYHNFTKIMDDQTLSKIMQLPMDGPDINWKFYEQLTDELDTRIDSALLYMGFRELQVAFQNGYKLAG